MVMVALPTSTPVSLDIDVATVLVDTEDPERRLLLHGARGSWLGKVGFTQADADLCRHHVHWHTQSTGVDERHGHLRNKLSDLRAMYLSQHYLKAAKAMLEPAAINDHADALDVFGTFVGSPAVAAYAIALQLRALHAFGERHTLPVDGVKPRVDALIARLAEACDRGDAEDGPLVAAAKPIVDRADGEQWLTRPATERDAVHRAISSHAERRAKELMMSNRQLVMRWFQ